jgi:rare lipoprotein A
MLSGQHAPRHRATRRNLIPATVGVLVAVLLIGGAIASLRLGPSTPTSSPVTANESRTAGDRADRSELRELPVQSASPTPSLSPSKGPSPTPTPTRSRTSPRSTPPTSAGVASTGTCGVSYYDTGHTTANGERFDPNGLTAAHKTLPFDTRVRVTNPANGKSVIVRINDRGPFIGGRCLDLARGAFVMIASISAGVINNARYEVLK